MTRISGYCPACGSGTLFVGDGGHVTCYVAGCPEPDAADSILSHRKARKADRIDRSEFCDACGGPCRDESAPVD